MNNEELNLQEMENVNGGFGGYAHKPREKAGFMAYQIVKGDNLTKIAKRFNTTVDYLVSINRSVIPNRNDITSGYYIYVPV